MSAELTGVDRANWIAIDLEIPIAAPGERVWQAIVEETDAWWLADGCRR